MTRSPWQQVLDQLASQQQINQVSTNPASLEKAQAWSTLYNATIELAALCKDQYDANITALLIFLDRPNLSLTDIQIMTGQINQEIQVKKF